MGVQDQNQRIRDFFADMAKGFALVWQYGKRLTIVNCCLFVLQALLPLVSLHILRLMIDGVVRGHSDWHQFGPWLLLFGATQLANFLISQVSDYYVTVQQQLTSDNIAEQVLNKAIELPLKYYEAPSFYDQLHMVQQQSLSRPAQLITATLGIIQNATMVIAFSMYMLTIHWSVLVLLFLLGIPLAVSKLIHGYRQFRLDKEVMPTQRQAADLYNYLTTYAYAKEVRVFGFGSDFISRFLHLRKFIFHKKKELHYHFLKQNLVIQFFEIIVIIAIYAIVILRTIAGTVSMGGLVVYFQLFQRLQNSITALFQSGINLFQHQLYLRELLRYLAIPADVANNREQMPSLSRGISVEKLSFTYPETGQQILHNISMEFKPARITAIVGENGSGKSTLMKLLCRLYDAEAGSILFDGVAISQIDTGKLQNGITAVFQDFGKYYLSIEDNITLGAGKKNKSQLEQAAFKSGIAEKINTFPGKYNTHLGRTFRNGEQLSGGQWQKIALARSFYKNSNLLILDEPTSSLDPVAEFDIFQELKKSIGNKVVILITHRLYNLKIADHIYVLDNGNVAESGSFSELRAAGGVFARMYEKQTI